MTNGLVFLMATAAVAASVGYVLTGAVGLGLAALFSMAAAAIYSGLIRN